MQRAAIIIGIDRTGDLPRLRDAARGAALMEQWARAQGIETIHLLTDAQAPVTVAAVKTAIKTVVDAANVSQLIVYFAGHGVNRQRHEYWLLSDAPDDPQAAVNVAGSVALAETCGIPHTIFISDACRTAAEGIRAQSVTGSEIFPNREGTEKPVDQFFACQLGSPSHEIRDSTVTSAEFKALYTGELVPALLGRHAGIVEWSGAGDAETGLVRLRPLRDHVSTAMAARLEALALQTKLIQVPVAKIGSDPPAWISRITRRAAGAPLGFGPPAPMAPQPPGPPTNAAVASTLLHAALADDIARIEGEFARDRTGSGTAELVGAAERLAVPFGPLHQETGCAFKIRGTRIAEAFSPSATLEFRDDLAPHGAVVRVNSVARPGGTVLLVLEDGNGVVLPAIPGFLAALTVEGGELVDVAYEPSEGTDRWYGYVSRLAETRALRAIISASMTRGSFHLDRDDALAIARRMQNSKAIDPALAVYAAYGYQDLGRGDLIKDMRGFMESDLGAPLFDVALLARALNRKTIGPDARLLSPVPLLSQGWALLSAYQVRLAPALGDLQAMLRPSLWTMLDHRGVEQVKTAMDKGEIR